MKKSLVSLIIFLGIISKVSFAQVPVITEKNESNIRQNLITVDPLKFFYFFWNVSYYHSINSFMSAGFTAKLSSWSKFKGGGIDLEARVFPLTGPLKNFYIAPNISWDHLNAPVALAGFPNAAEPM